MVTAIEILLWPEACKSHFCARHQATPARAVVLETAVRLPLGCWMLAFVSNYVEKTYDGFVDPLGEAENEDDMYKLIS